MRLAFLAFVLLLALPGASLARIATTAPTLTSPASSSQSGRQLAVQYTLPDTPAPNSVTLTFSNTTTVVTLNLDDTTSGSHSFTFDVQSPVGGSVASASAPGIPDGTYTVTLTYQDVALSAAASASSTGVVVDTTTTAPHITAPSSSSSSTQPFTVGYQLAEACTGVSLAFTYTAPVTADGIQYVGTLYTVQLGGGASAGTHTVVVTVGQPTAWTVDGAHTVTGSGGPLPTGIYSIAMTCAGDLNGNGAAASTPVWNVTLQWATPPPTLFAVVDGAHTSAAQTSDAVIGGTFTITYRVPTPAFGSAELVFSGPASATIPFSTTGVTNGLASVTSTFRLADAKPAPPPDGTYSVALRYTDFLQNPAATSGAITVTVDTTTQPPTFAPAPRTWSGPTPLSFTLPEAPLAGSVLLQFHGPGDYGVVLPVTSSGAQTVTVDPGNLALAGSPTAQNVVPDGPYTVTLSYRDGQGNPVAASAPQTIRVDTVTSPLSAAVGTATHHKLPIALYLGDAPLGGTVHVAIRSTGQARRDLDLTGMTRGVQIVVLDRRNLARTPGAANVTGPTSLPAGTYTLTFSYRDALGNDVSSTKANITLKALTPTPR